MRQAVWDHLWQQHPGLPQWDRLSQEVWSHLSRSVPDLSGRRVLEAGCGSGRISYRAAAQGASICLVDLSWEALELARQFAGPEGRQAQLCQADIMALPLASGVFDVVWNAGVLEHFGESDRVRVVRELARVCKPGGRVVTFVPNARAMVYMLAKRRAEAAGKWVWGYEEPISSMGDVFRQAGLTLLDEGPVAAQHEMSFARSFITGDRVALALIKLVLHGVLRPLGRAGYLLASVGGKNA